MEKIIIEMPLVSRCDVEKCAFNMKKSCYAKAITIGDITNPECDTFFSGAHHSKKSKRVAGVGACKVESCQYNNDFDCTAESIIIGITNKKNNCLTYTSRHSLDLL